jgi:hypothetical protein
MADTSDVMVAIRYIFIISVILVLVAYYAGTVKVGTAFGTQLTNLVNVSTGRNPTTGVFSAYPTGS